MIILAMLKKWRFWIFVLDWRICVINAKQVAHIFLRTKRLGVNNLWWADFDSLFGGRKLKYYSVYLFNYSRCLDLLYSPFGGYCTRLDQLVGLTFNTPDYIKYHNHGNRLLWVSKAQAKCWLILSRLGLHQAWPQASQ